ncbi:MAG TPA: Sec-independent protein translocase protein TatB [Lichenihabitans sp.]|jgi:sec-independent protein translocase protein TatB|nr:Sec-independent protein translocase protein TatB [Lichenihabitans sp.]
MLDFDAGKLLIIGVVALVVIGPKDLPRVLRQVGQMMGRVRRMAGEFQGQFMEAIKEADLQDLRTEVAKLKDTARLDVDFDPARDVKHELLSAVNGTGTEPVRTAAADTLEAPSPVPHASESLPFADAGEPSTVAAAGIAPAAVLPAAAESLVPDPVGPPAQETVEAREPRRKIVVSRRRGLSRFDGSHGRAAIPYRSRNILPARRETPDP